MINKNFINLILYFLVCYIVFFTIFFLSFSIVSVDTVIAMGLVFLFFLIYFFSNKQITIYLLLQSKVIYKFFLNIIYLIINLKMLLLSLNNNNMQLLWYKFNSMYTYIHNLDFINYKYIFIKKFYINNINNIFLKNLLFIENLNKILNNLKLLNINLTNLYLNDNIILILLNS